jgi:hypothetical protein
MLALWDAGMENERRGLRFPFSANGEIVVESSRNAMPARVMELSLRGCFLEVSSALTVGQHLRVRIWHANEFFEALAEVLYVRATGVGLVFNDMKPHSRKLLMAWVLGALDSQVKLEHS